MANSDELVQEGAMGTGAYAAMLLSAFENRGTKYAFEGATATGRKLYEYSFSVSVEQSRYKVKARKDWVITGYTGTILVDPKTSDLVRLTVRTEELPPETNTCETTTSLEYGLVQLSGGDYLLPTMASQRFIGRDAYEAENTMSFSACRDFHAESTLDFGDKSAAAAKPPAPPPGAGDLPQGLPVTVELIQAIPFAAAAAGDRIEGRLAAPVHGLGGTTLLPAGALLRGHLRNASKPATRLARSAPSCCAGKPSKSAVRRYLYRSCPIAPRPKKLRSPRAATCCASAPPSSNCRGPARFAMPAFRCRKMPRTSLPASVPSGSP